MTRENSTASTVASRSAKKNAEGFSTQDQAIRLHLERAELVHYFQIDF